MHNTLLTLARFVAQSRLDTIDESVQDEAVRAWVNWLGCALGGCLDPAVDTVMDAAACAAVHAQATRLGRGDRTDVLSAAMGHGVASTVLDYGDTHPMAGVAVAAPVAAAVIAVAQARALAGSRVVHAFVLGAEVACRAALALDAPSPRGSNAAALSGALGAAAACAKLLGLDEYGIADAIGIATTGANGSGERAATASRLLAPAIAARDGARAALYAQQHSIRPTRAPDAPPALPCVRAAEANAAVLLDALGSEWHFTRTVYHPYPGPITLHALIEACLQLKQSHKALGRDIEQVQLWVSPALAEEPGAREPSTPAQARSSAYHAAASALIAGAADPAQVAPERLANRRVAELRNRVALCADPRLSEQAARLEVRMRDGRVLERQVRCALGSPQRPLGDAELCAKFRRLAAETLSTDQAERMLALAWNMRALSDIGALVRASVPEDILEPAELPGSPLIPR